MNRLKYIVYKTSENGQVNSIIFPSLIGHDEMKRNMRATEVLGAGFCSFNKRIEAICETIESNGEQKEIIVGQEEFLTINCYGHSTSLNVQ